MAEIAIPTEEEAEKLLDEYHVPANVRRHSRKVAEVARFLAEKLKEKGIDINPELVYMAGLLHDIVRSVNFDTIEACEHYNEEDAEFLAKLKEKHLGEDHADVGADILKDKYPELAEVIRSHAMLPKVEDPADKPWEWQVLIYADGRVSHDKIVSLDERFKDLNERCKAYYSMMEEKHPGYIKKHDAYPYILEKNIFSVLDITPEEVNEL